MADDKKVDVEFSASTDQLKTGVKDAANAVKTGVNDIKGSLGVLDEGFKMLSAGFLAFTAVLAGGATLKSFVDTAINSTQGAVSLGRAFGITATEASYLADAAANVGVSTDTLTMAGSRLTMRLVTNEKAFHELGVKTRTASGDLRNAAEVMQDVNERLRGFKEGSDRNIEGMKIYGRSWAELSPMVAKFKGITDESRKGAEDLNQVIGVEAVNAMMEYKTMQINVNDVMEGIGNTVGFELLPRLTALGNWFSDIGPDAVTATRVAIAGYLTVQDSIIDSVTVVLSVITTTLRQIVGAFMGAFGPGGQTITAMTFFMNVVKVVQVAFIGFRVGIEEACAVISGVIDIVGAQMKGMAEITIAALHLDWDGVKRAASGTAAAIADSFEKSTAKMVSIATKGREDIEKALTTDISKAKPVTAIPEPTGGARSSGATIKKESDERMKAWEADLLNRKIAFMRENDMREMSLADEEAYWRKILSTLDKSDKLYEAVRKQAVTVELATLKKAAAEKIAINAASIEQQQNLSLESLDLERIAAEERLLMGIINDKEMLILEEQFENKKLEINRKALVDRLELLRQDPTKNVVEIAKINHAIEELESKHVTTMAKIASKARVESTKGWLDMAKQMESAFQQGINGFISGTMTFREAFRSIMMGILDAFTQMVAKMVAQWIMSLIQQKIAQSFTALAQVQSNAAVAGSAAFASTAAIPIVGPVLAPGAAAAAYAGALSFGALASARNGFDIPAGLNPVTQLHEKEMVLPQAQADAVRDMANGDGGSKMPSITINAVDARSVRKLFMENGDALMAALRKQHRNFSAG